MHHGALGLQLGCKVTTETLTPRPTSIRLACKVEIPLSAKLHCEKAKKPVPVPRGVDVMWSGFECVSLSSLCVAGMATEDMRDTSSKSAAAFHQTLEVLKVHKPMVAMLENVKKLLSNKLYGGMKALDYFREKFAANGFAALEAQKCNTLRFLLPQCRNRVVLLGTRLPTLRNHLAMLHIFHSPPLVPAQALVEHQEPKKPTVDSSGWRWIAHHDAWAEENRLSALDTFEKREAVLRAGKPWNDICTQRERHLVLLHVAKLQRARGAVSGLLLVDQEVHRTSVNRQWSPCITPNARLLDLEAWRFLTAGSKAALQGFQPSTLARWGYQDSAKLNSHAGNAFPAVLALLWWICALDALAMQEGCSA